MTQKSPENQPFFPDSLQKQTKISEYLRFSAIMPHSIRINLSSPLFLCDSLRFLGIPGCSKPFQALPDANARPVVKKCWLGAWPREFIAVAVSASTSPCILHGLGRSPGAACWWTQWDAGNTALYCHYKILQNISIWWNCWQLFTECTGLLAKDCPAICKKLQQKKHAHFNCISTQNIEQNDDRAWKPLPYHKPKLVWIPSS